MDNLLQESGLDLTPTIPSTPTSPLEWLPPIQNIPVMGNTGIGLEPDSDFISPSDISPTLLDTSNPHLDSSLGNLPLSFIANVGQIDPEVEFLVQGAQHDIFFTPDEIVLNKSQVIDDETVSHQVKVSFAGANPDPTIDELAPLPGVANFITGDDPSQWHENVPTYQGITYQNLYDGIDLIYRGDEGELKSEFIVSPGVDPGQIRMNYEGSDRLNIREDGALVIETPFGELVESAPYLYQDINGERVTVSGAYQLLDNAQVGFTIGEYDPSVPLAIDPTLDYTTYLAPTRFDGNTDIAIDDRGDLYVIGTTPFGQFPTPDLPPTSTPPNVLISKFSNDGTLLYSTFLGGNNASFGEGIATDSGGNVYVTGTTTANDFPTLNGIQSALNGNSDAFITKLSNTGSLVYSTFLGGMDSDVSRDIAVDNNSNIYVTGYSQSSDFPLLNAVQNTYNGSSTTFPSLLGDAFVTKLSSEGELVYSTFLGGSDDEGGIAITADAEGNAYITGETYSSNFPVLNAIQPNLSGFLDIFLTKLSSNGRLVYSTYLGGTNGEIPGDIALDESNQIYLIGTTYVSGRPIPMGLTEPPPGVLPPPPYMSSDRSLATDSAINSPATESNENQRAFSFPTVNPFQSDLGGNPSAVVVKLPNDGSRLIYSTLLGGTNWDEGHGIIVDQSGNAYVTGLTRSADFPTVNAFQTKFRSFNPRSTFSSPDAFVSKLTADGSQVEYSTYLGGSGDDTGRKIALDNQGNVYVIGTSSSPDLPNPKGGTAFRGNNLFLAKVTPESGPLVEFPFISLVEISLMQNYFIGPLIVFDENFYRATNPDVDAAVTGGIFLSGFDHFERFGQVEGRQPSLLYNEPRYLAENPDVAAAVAAGQFRSGFEHFRSFGFSEGRDRRTTLFDEQFYRTIYPDIIPALTSVSSQGFASGYNHYIAFGQRERRNPNRYFDESFYLATYPDVAAAVEAGTLASGFEHFAYNGEIEGRQPSPLFNEQFYRATYPDVAAAVASGSFRSGFDHFLQFGSREGRAGVG
ncbi:SBBP repeat-containing protein [Laspinema palackyanum]|uniref:DUF7948 domain-containing protein n=1 Tax=Laspinema palackyanum TaxID=3231601 RepID=UPI00345D9AA1|nr:SBBP repeat-containing protein [Laspinema sp. D2c]